MRHLRTLLTSADLIGAAGLVCLAIGAGLAWLPAGFLVAGAALLFLARSIARTEAP